MEPKPCFITSFPPTVRPGRRCCSAIHSSPWIWWTSISALAGSPALPLLQKRASTTSPSCRTFRERGWGFPNDFDLLWSNSCLIDSSMGSHPLNLALRALLELAAIVSAGVFAWNRFAGIWQWVATNAVNLVGHLVYLEDCGGGPQLVPTTSWNGCCTGSGPTVAGTATRTPGPSTHRSWRA